MLESENKPSAFEVKCLECGSTDVEVMSSINGVYYTCQNTDCGIEEEVVPSLSV